MTERGSWFRCDSSRLLGALAGMEPDCGYLYTVILLRIYEVGGPISDDERTLARRTGLSPKKIAAALAWLIKYGKIDSLENGYLDSATTHAELAFREKSIKDAIKAGKESSKRKQNFKLEKQQQNQHYAPTPDERTFDDGPTDWERSPTDIEVESDIESEGHRPASYESVSVQEGRDSSSKLGALHPHARVRAA
jgi:uncharacterized protein YdaU (DUF1376 family)